MRKIIISFIIFISITNINYGSNEDIIESQEKQLNISNFIQEADKYTNEQFENIDIKNLLNSAIKGEIDNSVFYKNILNIFGLELTDTLKTLRYNCHNCYYT